MDTYNQLTKKLKDIVGTGSNKSGKPGMPGVFYDAVTSRPENREVAARLENIANIFKGSERADLGTAASDISKELSLALRRVSQIASGQKPRDAVASDLGDAILSRLEHIKVKPKAIASGGRKALYTLSGTLSSLLDKAESPKDFIAIKNKATIRNIASRLLGISPSSPAAAGINDNKAVTLITKLRDNLDAITSAHSYRHGGILRAGARGVARGVAPTLAIGGTKLLGNLAESIMRSSIGNE